MQALGRPTVSTFPIIPSKFTRGGGSPPRISVSYHWEYHELTNSHNYSGWMELCNAEEVPLCHWSRCLLSTESEFSISSILRSDFHYGKVLISAQSHENGGAFAIFYVGHIRQ